MSPQYTTVGGYPNTDPYYITPEEEAEMHEEQKPHRFDATDDVECWHVEYVASLSGGWTPFCRVFLSKGGAEEGAENCRGQPGFRCIRITGPHIHKMPATKDWCLNMAAKEGNAEIGAGLLAIDPEEGKPASAKE